MSQGVRNLTRREKICKRIFDIVLAMIGFVLTIPLMVVAMFFVYFSTGDSPLFSQVRVGQGGKRFNILKIRTMSNSTNLTSTVTTSDDIRITSVGKVLRDWKIDELPQLFNVLRGDMSFVGPRPDVPGFADQLIGEDKILLTLKPGITGPASLVYRNEEEILANQVEPEKYNRDVLYPQKVKINKEYVANYSLFGDVLYILKTIFPHFGTDKQ